MDMNNYGDENYANAFLVQDSLVQSFKNVGISSRNRESYGALNHSGSHPLRPYADDCSHFLRSGTCKFGLSCKYNHPVRRNRQMPSRGSDLEGNSEKAEGMMECKYYLTAAGCKYGDSCKFSHAKVQSDMSAPELNFLGLPIRMGEKVCPFYMRHGSCGYGSRCVFHHPDPTSFGGFNPFSSAMNHTSVGEQGYSSAISNDEVAQLHMPGASRADYASWSSPMPSGVEGYQVPAELHGSKMPRSSAPAQSSFVRMGAPSEKIDEHPERPGQPECDFYMKTGDCKFKSDCRFHHPKDRTPEREMCTLSDKGLPLRPGKSICRHYERFGICKYGRACLFDHPVNPESSTAEKTPEWSSSERVQSHDTGLWDK